jgi:hypothetical protein
LHRDYRKDTSTHHRFRSVMCFIWALVQFMMAVDIGIIHVILVLLAHREQELQGHGGFRGDFRGKPRRPDSV